MGKDAPEVPDYRGAAEEQAESSREVTNMQTWANRPNQTTPWGNSRWDPSAIVDPATGQTVTQWSQNIELSPQQQEALDSQMAVQAGRSGLAESLLGRSEEEFGSAMDWSNLPEAGQNVQGTRLDSSQRYYDEAGDALVSRFDRRMNPQFERDRSAQEARLTNQGLRPGDKAFDDEMNKLGQRQGDMRLDAYDQATMQSGAEASRMFGMDAAASGQNFGQGMESSRYATALRQQKLAETMQRRGFSLNEINAILYGQQVGMPGMPDFMAATKSDATNYLQAAESTHAADLDKFNAKQAQMQMALDAASSFNPMSFGG